MKNNLPHPRQHGATAMFTHQALSVGAVKTPALDKFRSVAADCKRAAILDSVLHSISQLSEMPPDEVAEILRALERAERGECSVSLQEAREDAESHAKLAERMGI